MMMMILHMFLKSGLITKNCVGAGLCWILAVKSSIQTAGVDWTLLMCVCFWRIIVLKVTNQKERSKLDTMFKLHLHQAEQFTLVCQVHIYPCL